MHRKVLHIRDGFHAQKGPIRDGFHVQKGPLMGGFHTDNGPIRGGFPCTERISMGVSIIDSFHQKEQVKVRLCIGGIDSDAGVGGHVDRFWCLFYYWFWCQWFISLML